MEEKETKADDGKIRRKPNLTKLLMLFMILCILCSLICNIMLYRRIIALKEQIKRLNITRVTTEQLIQEVGYEFI